jgi:predicted PurR-regulated permease PerM
VSARTKEGRQGVETKASRPVLPDITRITLIVLIIGILLVASLWTMLPFLGSLVWAAAIVVATWPLLLRVQGLLWGRRSLATAAMTTFMLLIFIAPFWIAIASLLDASMEGIEVAHTYLSKGLSPPPHWVSGIPLVGGRLAARWQALAAAGPEGLTNAVRPYAPAVATWMVTMTGGFGTLVLNFVMTVIIAAILYAQGELAGAGFLAFGRRIGAERGERMVRLAGNAVRGVALGVVVTAILQAGLAGLGLWVSGTPHPGLLTAAAFVLCIAQVGPLPVFAAAVAWHFWSGRSGWGTALVVWTLVVGPLDNILRPILIRRGVDLPLLLIIAGVIGGLLGFGVIGLFIGPVILAVTYSSLEAWVKGPLPAPAEPETETEAETQT